MRLYLQLRADENTALKFCHLHLQKDLFRGWNMIKEMGYQGTPGRINRKHFSTYDAALTAIMNEKDRQTQRGYHIVFAHGEYPENKSQSSP